MFWNCTVKFLELASLCDQVSCHVCLMLQSPRSLGSVNSQTSVLAGGYEYSVGVRTTK